MAMTLAADQVRDVFARLQEHEIDAEPALSWLGWDGCSPVRILRHDLLVYLWYELPAKFLAPVKAQHDVAADPDRLAEPVHAAIAEDGWHAGGAPPSRRDVSWTVTGFLLRAEPVGIVAWRERRLTAAGRTALHHGLRARALGPARSIL